MEAFDHIKQLAGRDEINHLAKFTGESDLNCSKAMDQSIALILAGMSAKAEDSNTSMKIWNLVRLFSGKDNWKDQLPLLFSGKLPDSLPGSAGSDLLAILFGGNSNSLKFVSQVSGFNSDNAAGKVFSIAAPLVLNVLKEQINHKQLELPGFYSWLASSKEKWETVLPSGFSSLLKLNSKSGHALKASTHDNNTSVGSLWWLYISGVVALIAGLFILLQKCNREELTDKANNAMRVMSAAMDSAKIKADLVGKSAQEMLDTTGLRFKESWKALGNKMNIRLGEFELKLPEKGIELKLLDWIQSKTTKVDKTTWFNFDRILFQTASSNLNNVSSEQIGNIATIMKAIPIVEFKIGGYTDSTGDPAENKKLSQARAEAVMNALIEQGIDASRLTAEGYGSEFPVADNNTPEGREQNRRVAIRVTKK